MSEYSFAEEKRKMKKIIALLLAVCLLACLCACGNVSTAPASSGSNLQPTEQAAETVTTLAAGTLSIATSPDFPPYEMLGEMSLKAEGLAKYKVLYIGASGCLSDRDLAAIKEFAKAGGTVHLSTNAGGYDELGLKRKKWAFAEIPPRRF